MNISLEQKRIIEDIIHYADSVRSAQGYKKHCQKKLNNAIAEYRILFNTQNKL